MLVCNVLVSDEQQSDSSICACVCVCVCMHVYVRVCAGVCVCVCVRVLFSSFPLWALLQDSEHSSLCSTVDPRCLFYGQ